MVFSILRGVSFLSPSYCEEIKNTYVNAITKQANWHWHREFSLTGTTEKLTHPCKGSNKTVNVLLRFLCINRGTDIQQILHENKRHHGLSWQILRQCVFLHMQFSHAFKHQILHNVHREKRRNKRKGGGEGGRGGNRHLLFNKITVAALTASQGSRWHGSTVKRSFQSVSPSIWSVLRKQAPGIKNKISNRHMLDSPWPSDRVLRCRPSTVQSKWQNRDKSPNRKDFKILHHAQVICMKFTLRPFLLLITTVIIIKTFYHSFLKF